MQPSYRTFVKGLALVLAAVALPLRADEAPHLSKDRAMAIISGLHWQTGTITLKDGLAKINLTDKYRYLGADDARKVFHDIWGNPDDPGLLGMIFPADKGPLDEDDWAVTVDYEDSGYVKDSDADKINYSDLLKNMQAAVKEQTPERVKEGYPAFELVGWAEPPHYDKASHKLYWAKDLKFQDGSSEDALNYDIRILGRRGVLVLSALAGMNQLAEVKEATPSLLSMVDFQSGNTYGEFDPKIDKVAQYGLEGLIAGGVLAGAAKLGLFAGLFKWILAGAIAAKKVLIVAVVAIATGAKKLWASMTGRRKTPDHLLPPGGNVPPS